MMTVVQLLPNWRFGARVTGCAAVMYVASCVGSVKWSHLTARVVACYLLQAMRKFVKLLTEVFPQWEVSPDHQEPPAAGTE